jgi:ADP-ribosylglycohydrolase
MMLGFSQVSSKVMRDLLTDGRIRFADASLLRVVLPPVQQRNLRDRFEGMLLGVAVGDALGNTSESMTPAQRRQRYGEITDYLTAPGQVSDDGQLTFWTIETMLQHFELLRAFPGTHPSGLLRSESSPPGCDFSPEHVAARFAFARSRVPTSLDDSRGWSTLRSPSIASRRIRGIGKTVRAALRAKKNGAKWDEMGQASAGNGALMRFLPPVLPHLRGSGEALWEAAAFNAMLTHNEPLAIATNLAMTRLLFELLERDEAPAPAWWWQRFCEILAPLESDSVYRSRAPALQGFEGTLSALLEAQLPSMLARDASVEEACNHWYSGAYLLETVPSVLYILSRHGHSFEEAVTRAVNDTWDNDTIASIVASLMGALHGRGAIPQRWLEGLDPKTSEQDERGIFTLIDDAWSILVEEEHYQDDEQERAQ